MIGPECVAQQKKLVAIKMMNCGERSACARVISTGSATPGDALPGAIAGAFCASTPVARKPVMAQSAQAAKPRRVNIGSSLRFTPRFDPTADACQAGRFNRLRAWHGADLSAQFVDD